MDTKTIFDKYFRNNPENLDHLRKAHFAFHANHTDRDGHYFFREGNRLDKCMWCERSREQIRYDELPAECQQRPLHGFGQQHIEETLASEEQKYHDLLNRSKDEIPKILNRKFNGVLSGEALCYFQNTHGYDPDCVAHALDVEIECYMEHYEEHMGVHKSMSGKFKK